MIINELELLKDLQNAKGSIAKKKILDENRDNFVFGNLLLYILNPLYSYKVSENFLFKDYATIEDLAYTNKYIEIDQTLYEANKTRMLNSIMARMNNYKSLSNVDKQVFKDFIILNFPAKYHELIDKILAKTIKLGITAKTVNKVIPDLIPVWDVQQAYAYEKYPIKNNQEFVLTEKLNGVRCTYYKGVLRARSGHQFNGMEHILKDLEKFNNKYVFDGELILLDKGNLSDNEAFRVATGIINSDAEDKTEIGFKLFDMVNVDEFENKFDCVKFTNYFERREFLDKLDLQSQHISITPILYKGNDISQIDTLLDKMVEEDKEGLMLNLDTQYKCTRHRGILKIKRFYTVDLLIIGTEEGCGRLEGTMGALVVDYKGNKLSVGSGFTDEQRVLYWTNRDSLIGKICEVRYKEISTNKKTELESLQFSSFVQIRNDKDDVSYD